jgi:methyl-accepting chemotaxis protein
MNLKNVSVKAKLLLGFGLVVVLTSMLSVFALRALTTVSGNYRNNLSYSQQRVQIVLGIRYDAMNLRRITTAIRADSGMEDRQTGHRTATNTTIDSINQGLDLYEELLINDRDLTQEEKNELLQIAKDKRSVTERYRDELILPNIAFGMVGDAESAAANTASVSTLITEFNTTTDKMVDLEKELAAELITKTKGQTDIFLVAFIIISIFIAIVCIILALVISGRISKPLTIVTAAAEAISMGDINVEGLDEGVTMTRNEITLLERAFSHMIECFKKQAYVLARVAEGDYTAKIDIRSDKDTINLAIDMMQKETLTVLTQVADAGVQVSDGSREIASGAQLLADGAAQQSATVEQLSASMAEMAKMTKVNAGKADRAASLATKIKDNAEKGNSQMHDMIQAVKEINEASQSISKVIKIIDDIAFQTNILALNAAVEAARAGQHGKGFAVVAEEVRNLAAKSAEAAKDTGEMISNSMEKAELGSRIASETAASLEEIVIGIVESTQIVGEIAEYSNQQTSSIEEIDRAISQVAEVIHQNSATAEESAAASSEMSQQSALLEELIMQFQLRETSGGFKKKR